MSDDKSCSLGKNHSKGFLMPINININNINININNININNININININNINNE
jgi:hypothetical protein